jgi:hypothetical protein
VTFADARTLARRLFSGLVWHLHEWESSAEYEVGGVFIESRFCGIASCQRYEIWNPLTLRWEEHTSGYPGL